MEKSGPLLPQQHRVRKVNAGDESPTPAGILSTRDHEVIRHWAVSRTASPAIGSGTLHVEDGGSALRFNFPGASRFDPASWEDWLSHFDREGLTFVFEERNEPQPSYRYRIVRESDWDGQF